MCYVEKPVPVVPVAVKLIETRMEPGPVILGGWQPTLPNPPNTATADVQLLVAKLRPQIQEKLNMDLGDCQALFFYSQLVAGMNYLILVSYSHSRYI